VTNVAARPLTTDERRVLDLMLSAEFEGVEELRCQAGEAVVIGRCRCGCPTIDLDVSSDSPPSAIPGPLAPFEGRVSTEGEAPSGEIILFVKAGFLTSMEYVYYTDLPPTEWPGPDRLALIEKPNS
jgi:hypothetical protein